MPYSTLLACFQGPVVVETEASTVLLIHFTLQKYPQAHPELFGAARATITETCLNYLNSQKANAFSVSRSADLQEKPLSE